ncbi:NUDIX hydrolase [Paenibacillus hamazuiensis]|uniref:NUDIX hydrolase n=1 Tax=Paenibacillus hamazuiensis TaxID=2936508 RepID=UPI00200D81D8|nr:NUDIX domain-containing protein [Paenibacillus hamazuiensis]
MTWRKLQIWTRKEEMALLTYTICFICRGEQVLMLNRSNAPQMGMWSGVGGKLEADESPMEGVLREIAEETGLAPEAVQVRFAGTVTWEVDDRPRNGMYAYVARLPMEYAMDTPRDGVSPHVKRCLVQMLENEACLFQDSIPKFFSLVKDYSSLY